MKKLLIIASLILTVTAAHAREGYYIGAEVGAGFLSRTPKKGELLEGSPAGAKAKRDRVRFLAGIHGGYLFDIDEQLSVAPQIGFRYVQKAKFTSTEATGFEDARSTHQLNVIDFLAVGTYKMNALWDLQAKVGAAFVADKVKDSLPANPAVVGDVAFNKSKTKKSVRPEVGFGVGYAWRENMRLSLDASHIFGKRSSLQGDTPEAAFNNFAQVPSLTSVSLSLQYMF